ncbi:replication protein P [Yersinia mollaretii]|uniref:replication protein P n=1 Tax=Yersinia mollaretii TaxID=33060 RepID=UPI0011A97DC1|nr:replication protein P [Yersinia mollaretii]
MSRRPMTDIAHRGTRTLAKLYGGQPDSAEGRVNPKAVKLVDALFRQLKQVFPAASLVNLRSEQEESAAKKQWIAAFAENGICTREQLSAGMRHARSIESPFWPSPGQFIGWCKQGARQAAGLPDVDAVMVEFQRYCARRDGFDSPEQFPWQAPVLYWIVIEMRTAMLQYNHSETDLRKMAERKLKSWAKRIDAGYAVPQPVLQLPDLQPPETIGGRLGQVTARTEALGKAMLDSIRQRIASESKTED